MLGASWHAYLQATHPPGANKPGRSFPLTTISMSLRLPERPTSSHVRRSQAVNRWKLRAAAAAFAAWVQYCQRKRAARRFAAHIQWTATYLRMRRAFLAWTALRARKRERNERLLAARRHLSQRRMCLRFDSW